MFLPRPENGPAITRFAVSKGDPRRRFKLTRLISNVTTMLVLRGVLAILFGIVALAWPGITLMALVALFGAFALIDGIAALAAVISNATSPFPRWVLALDGAAGIAAGLVTLFFPA